MAREKDAEELIRAHIKIGGGWSVKIHADAVQGRETLDLIGSYKGKPFMVDIKSPTGKESVLQSYLIRRARAGGYVAGIARSPQEFEELFHWLP